MQVELLRDDSSAMGIEHMTLVRQLCGVGQCPLNLACPQPRRDSVVFVFFITDVTMSVVFFPVIDLKAK